MQEAEGKAVQEPEVMLNYDQYYPTILPLRQPGMEETDAEVHARDDRPPDLSLHKVCNTRQSHFSFLCTLYTVDLQQQQPLHHVTNISNVVHAKTACLSLRLFPGCAAMPSRSCCCCLHKLHANTDHDSGHASNCKPVSFHDTEKTYVSCPELIYYMLISAILGHCRRILVVQRQS